MERRIVENERDALRRRLKVAPEKQQEGNLVGKRLDGILLDVVARPPPNLPSGKFLRPCAYAKWNTEPQSWNAARVPSFA